MPNRGKFCFLKGVDVKLFSWYWQAVNLFLKVETRFNKLNPFVANHRRDWKNLEDMFEQYKADKRIKIELKFVKNHFLGWRRNFVSW